MGDVGKRPAVDKGGGMLQGLHQIGLQSVLQQGGHGARRLQLAGGHRFPVIGVAHDNGLQPALEIGDVLGEAQHRHDLTGHGDVKPVLPGHAAHPATQAVHHIPQLPVVHIHAAPPGDPSGINAQGVALVDVVVHHGRQQVIGGANGV